MFLPSVQFRSQYPALFHQYLNGLNGFNHHGDPLERVRASVELCPVHSVLVAAAVMASSVPNPIQVRVSTHVVPPAPLLVVSTVTWRKTHRDSIKTAADHRPRKACTALDYILYTEKWVCLWGLLTWANLIKSKASAFILSVRRTPCYLSKRPCRGRV